MKEEREQPIPQHPSTQLSINFNALNWNWWSWVRRAAPFHYFISLHSFTQFNFMTLNEIKWWMKRRNSKFSLIINGIKVEWRERKWNAAGVKPYNHHSAIKEILEFLYGGGRWRTTISSTPLNNKAKTFALIGWFRWISFLFMNWIKMYYNSKLS